MILYNLCRLSCSLYCNLYKLSRLFAIFDSRQEFEEDEGCQDDEAVLYKK